MKRHQTAFLLILSIFMSACASTNTSYFKQAIPDKPHAVLQFEMGEKVGLLLDVSVAEVIPFSINGMPVNSWEQDWKLHAYGEFLIPPGDTIISLRYHNYTDGFVRFHAQQGEIYKVTHSINEEAVIFRVTNSNHQLVTSKLFKEKKYIYAHPALDMASALFEAAADGNIEKVRSLLNDGAEPDWDGPRGFTSLIVAASRGHKEVVQLLIKAGANVNADASWTALTFAADRGNESMVKLLLDSGAYIDLSMPGGYSALMAAAEKSHVGIVRMLLQKGAYTNTRDRTGKTALDLAKTAGNQEIVDMLKEASVKS